MAIVLPAGSCSHVRKLVFPEFTICAVSIVDGIVAAVQAMTFQYLADQSCAAFEMEDMNIYRHRVFFFFPVTFALIISDFNRRRELIRG